MKWRLIFGLLTLIVPSICCGQLTRTWTEARLKKEDFGGISSPQSPFQFKYDLVYAKKRQKIGSTIHVHWQANAVMFTEQSWLKLDTLVARHLAYSNLLFDYVEYYARRLTDELNVSVDFERSKRKTMEALTDVLNQIALETEEGINIGKVQFWQQQVDLLLAEKIKLEIPEFEYDKLKMAYTWGASYNYLNRKLGSQFTSPIALSNGAYFGWKRYMYGFHLTFIGKTTPTKSYWSNQNQFGDTARFKMTYNSFYFGYQCVQQPRLVITPYIGMSTMRFTLLDQQLGDKKYTNPLKASITAGLGIELRSKPFYQYNTSQFRYGLSGRFSYSPYNYLPTLAGNCFAFSLSLALYLDTIKNKL